MEIFFFGLCFGENNISRPDVQYGALKIVVSGFRNQKGIAQLTLFNAQEGFPDQVKYAYRTKSVPLSADRVEVLFRKLPYGIYAVGALHDENANGMLDKNFIGMPKEGTGASNDARGKMGPPSFQDARFVVNAETLTIHLHIFY